MDPLMNGPSESKPDHSFQQLLTIKLITIAKTFGFNRENRQKLSSVYKSICDSEQGSNLSFIWNHDKLFFVLFLLTCSSGIFSTFLLNALVTSIIAKCFAIPFHLLFNLFCFTYIPAYFPEHYQLLDKSSKCNRTCDVIGMYIMFFTLIFLSCFAMPIWCFLFKLQLEVFQAGIPPPPPSQCSILVNGADVDLYLDANQGIPRNICKILLNAALNGTQLRTALLSD